MAFFNCQETVKHKIKYVGAKYYTVEKAEKLNSSGGQGRGE